MAFLACEQGVKNGLPYCKFFDTEKKEFIKQTYPNGFPTVFENPPVPQQRFEELPIPTPPILVASIVPIEITQTSPSLPPPEQSTPSEDASGELLEKAVQVSGGAIKSLDPAPAASEINTKLKK